MSSGKEHVWLIRAIQKDLPYRSCRVQILTYFDSFECPKCSEYAYCHRYRRYEDKRIFR